MPLILMKNTKPTGFDDTTNPYGYNVGRPFAMVEKNELLYFETYGNSATGKIADVGTPSISRTLFPKKEPLPMPLCPYGHQWAQTYYAFVSIPFP